MSVNKIVRVENSTGGYYTLQSSKSKATRPFANDMSVCKSIQLLPDDVVVDIGAFVGEYTMLCSKQVKKVIAYEPTPATFEVLKMNAEKLSNVELINKAVVGNDDAQVSLSISVGVGGMNSIVKSSKTSIKVDAIKYQDAIREATVVKLDVEGGEYSFDIIQPHVRAYIIEFHRVSKMDWENAALRIVRDLCAAGYVSVVFPLLEHYFNSSGSWRKVTRE